MAIRLFLCRLAMNHAKSRSNFPDLEHSLSLRKPPAALRVVLAIMCPPTARTRKPAASSRNSASNSRDDECQIGLRAQTFDGHDRLPVHAPHQRLAPARGGVQMNSL